MTLTISNTGGVSTGTLAGSSSGTQFTVTDNCNGVVLAPSGTCTIDVRFAPTTTGGKTGSVTVMGTPGGTVSATLGGTGATPATLSLNPTTVNFGTVNNGSVSSQSTVTLSNTGGVPSGTPSVTLGGADMAMFRIATNNCMAAVPAGGNCTILLTFNPVAPGGSRTATLNVSASPGGSPSTTLNGDGACVPLTCQDVSAECGDIADGCGGVRNCGGCPQPMACNASNMCM